MKKLCYFAVFIFIVLAGCALWKAKSPGQNSGDIIFSHKKHIEMEAECEMCHAGAAESELSTDNNYPAEEDCLACHEREQCSLCHLNVDQAVHLVPEPTGLIFSHKAHLGSHSETIKETIPFVKEGSIDKQIDCSTCHDLVRESTKASDRYPIRIRVCLTCHEVADDNCFLCHSNLGEEGFIPASHDGSWLERHRHSAFADGEKFCSNCHLGRVRPSGEMMPTFAKDHTTMGEAKNCAECHSADLQPEGVHDSNYLYFHGIDALGNQNVCDSCHQREECLTCHAERGISSVDFHPAGWHFNHGDNARRQSPNCTACHKEEDCLSCHQVVSPHPSDWRYGHRDVARSNKEVCSRCHVGFCSRCHD